MDAMILKFVGENWLTFYLAVTLLKGIALITPSVCDDKIATLLSQLYATMRGGHAPDTIDYEPK